MCGSISFSALGGCDRGLYVEKWAPFVKVRICFIVERVFVYTFTDHFLQKRIELYLSLLYAIIQDIIFIRCYLYQYVMLVRSQHYYFEAQSQRDNHSLLLISEGIISLTYI